MEAFQRKLRVPAGVKLIPLTDESAAIPIANAPNAPVKTILRAAGAAKQGAAALRVERSRTPPREVAEFSIADGDDEMNTTNVCDITCELDKLLANTADYAVNAAKEVLVNQTERECQDRYNAKSWK